MIRGRKQKNKMKKRLKRALLLFFLILLAVAAYFVYRFYQNDKKQEDRFKELEETEDGWEKYPIRPKHPEETNNPDWIGWLKIEGTSISYPVMQKKGDGEYYLHRDFDGNYSFYGTPFLDARCTPESDNCIIYGHNINGGRMFGALHAYAAADYYRAHPEIRLRVGEEKRAYQIVSVMQTDTSSPVYSFTETGNWKEFQDYASRIVSGSLYHTEMGEEIREKLKEKTEEEFFRSYQFLTLSTCRSWVGKNARLLVIAARERDTSTGTVAE